MAKIAVVGSGIIGSTCARELAYRGHAVTLYEKERTHAMHASGRNSGVIHSGINQKPGSLKAQMSLKGSALLRSYCAQNGVPHEINGTLVIARDDRERETLDTLLDYATKCGVPGVEIIDQNGLRKIEPHAAGYAALYSPTGGIVDAKCLVGRVIDDAVLQGAQSKPLSEVLAIDDGTVIARGGPEEFDHVINAAGTQADILAKSDGVGSEYRIIPFRGDYLQVDAPCNSMIYPAPDLDFPFLGVHLTKTTAGAVLAGPTATLAAGRQNYSTWPVSVEMLRQVFTPQFVNLLRQKNFRAQCRHNIMVSLSRSHFHRELSALVTVPIDRHSIKHYRSGIRAQLVRDDGTFVDDILVESTQRTTHVLNAVSPGLTCSFAFAEYVRELVENSFS